MSMSRIATTFAALRRRHQKALIPFVTAGFPNPSASMAIIEAMVRGGADIIELGIPFSDPMADGPTIQRASEKALAEGMTLNRTLALVAEFRRRNETTPVVLMGYANPIEAMGVARFAEAASASGVDGVLIVDYPPEACTDIRAALSAKAIDLIFLLAPTSTPQRIREIRRLASGYVYYVSLTGVTGAAHLNVEAVTRKVGELARHFSLPIGVGFGIRDAKTAGQIAACADAVVIGSRVIEIIEDAGPDQAVALTELTAFLRSIRQAIDTAPLQNQ